MSSAEKEEASVFLIKRMIVEKEKEREDLTSVIDALKRLVD